MTNNATINAPNEKFNALYKVQRSVSVNRLIKAFAASKLGETGKAIFSALAESDEKCWFSDGINFYAHGLIFSESCEDLHQWLSTDSDSWEWMDEAYGEMRVFDYDFSDHIRTAKKLQLIKELEDEYPDIESLLQQYAALIELTNKTGGHLAVDYIPVSKFEDFLKWLDGLDVLDFDDIVSEVTELIESGFFHESEEANASAA